MQFYDDDDLTKEEEARVKKTWRLWARESERWQIVRTAAENKDLCSLIYDICHAELLARDRADDKRYQTAESRRVWAAVPLKKRPRMLKRRKLTGRVQAVNF